MANSNLIFLDVSNSTVSQMAEAFANQAAPEGVDVFSAGTQPDSSIDPLAVEVMSEYDIDVTDQRPKTIDDLNVNRFDMGITLCGVNQSSCPILNGAPIVLNWEIDDPALNRGSNEKFKERLKQIAERLQVLSHDLFAYGYFKAILNQQANLNNILNSVSDATIAHDVNRKIFFFSDGAAKMTGISPANAIGKDCHEVFSPRLCGKECSFCDGGDINFNEKQYGTIFYDVEGLRKELDVTIVPVRNVEGNMHGVVASLSDTTELKTLERELTKKKSFRGIIGCDHKMLQIFQQIRDVALYDYPVHVHGETGVGKELVAMAIHNESKLRTGPFVPINCGALPEGLVESELFGHVKGSFSGAIRDKKGRFELAKGGTIFLDEVADLPKQVQVKLLRFLQEGTLEKVGSEKTISVDVRVISATNKDLKQEVKKGNFREDLYYRLNVIPFDLPPLRQRKNDILLLCEHFLQQETRGHDSSPRNISSEAMSILMDYDWPGNVRELENTIRFAVVKCKEETIQAEDLPMELQASHSPVSQRGPSKKLDMETVKTALVKTGGNKAKAARFLGVGRATLYRFLDQFPEMKSI
ncbi:MAG: sigma 54-interacting transcriptional regulator [Proteobacteria bacterium]|nr:sigma 54-interacting transcriptional regulator [Pseudomonadota bacterium]